MPVGGRRVQGFEEEGCKSSRVQGLQQDRTHPARTLEPSNPRTLVCGMTHVSIELVPRSASSLAADLQLMRERLPAVRMVNIPDLLGFELRSWEACRQARASVPRAIPHLRAMDFD